jgi:hypothetical protein
MSREKMKSIQAINPRPIIAVHSCICGQRGPRADMRTWPLVNIGTREAPQYQCTRCNRIC